MVVEPEGMHLPGGRNAVRYDGLMATNHPAPDPFDEDLDRVLSDPAVIARLDAIAEKRKNGTLVTHSHEEVGKRLKGLGVPLLDEPDSDG